MSAVLNEPTKERINVTMKWRCGVCGYVHEGAEAPGFCPNCRAPQEKFDKLDAQEGLLKIIDFNKLGVAKGSGFRRGPEDAVPGRVRRSRDVHGHGPPG